MAMRGRKPKPRAWGTGDGPQPPEALPRCPDHLSDVARKEWRRIATPLHRMGVLSVVDRATLAAYCQAYGRWVEAERRLAETPLMLKTPSGYVQQSLWLSVANRQVELMNRLAAELGITPASRTPVLGAAAPAREVPLVINVLRTPPEADGDAGGVGTGEPAPDAIDRPR